MTLEFTERPYAESRRLLEQIGLPPEDGWGLPPSAATFSDGGRYRLELPTVNSADCCRAVLEEGRRLGLTINRLTETLGIMRHRLSELREYLAITRDFGCQLVVSVGPRATYGTGAAVRSAEGGRVGYRLRGAEQLVRAIEDVRRAIDLGCRWILVYDEGMLWALGKLRAQALLPDDTRFKLSAHCGHGNPASIRLLTELGADSINPVRDLELPMMASLRQSTSLPLDLHAETPESSGGMIRSYEAADMVRVASPVYLKTGGSALTHHGSLTHAQDGVHMARAAAVMHELLREQLPASAQSPANLDPTA